jgi:hypothetical protein
MDPNLFYLDYERLFEVLVTIIVFSFFVERALSVIFETRWFIKMYESNDKRKGLKEILALIVSIGVCIFWQFDAFSIVVVAYSEMQPVGYVLTGLIVAGGSKASIKLFKDVMGFMSSAEKERLESKKKNKEGKDS